MDKGRNIRILSLISSGMSYSEVARKVGVSRGVVAGVVSRDKASRDKKKWPVRDHSEEITKMAAEGVPAVDIAKALSLPRWSVISFCKIRDIPLVSAKDVADKKREEKEDQLKRVFEYSERDVRKACDVLDISESEFTKKAKKIGIKAGGELKKHQALALCALILKKVDNTSMADTARLLNTVPQRINGALSTNGLKLSNVVYDPEIDVKYLMESLARK